MKKITTKYKTHKHLFKSSDLSVYLDLANRGKRFYLLQCRCGDINSLVFSDEVSRYLKEE